MHTTYTANRFQKVQLSLILREVFFTHPDLYFRNFSWQTRPSATQTDTTNKGQVSLPTHTCILLSSCVSEVGAAQTQASYGEVVRAVAFLESVGTSAVWHKVGTSGESIWGAIVITKHHSNTQKSEKQPRPSHGTATKSTWNNRRRRPSLLLASLPEFFKRLFATPSLSIRFSVGSLVSSQTLNLWARFVLKTTRLPLKSWTG